jgi:hypothetical protein
MPEQLFGLEMVQGGGQHTAASCVADAIMICVFSAHWSFGKEVAAGRGSKHQRAVENPDQRPLPVVAIGQGLICPRLCPAMKAEIEGMVETAGGPDFLLQLRKVLG